MGNFFSPPSYFGGRRENIPGLVYVQHHQVDNTSAEKENWIQAEDYLEVNGHDLEQLDRDRRGSRDEPLHETTNTSKARTNAADVNISSAQFVNIGDNSTINIQATGQRGDTISVAYSTAVQGISVDQESQVRPPANNNITSDIVVLGEKNQICISNMDRIILVDLCFPPSPVVLQVNSPCKRLFNRMVKIINTLYPLRDRGKWQEFEDTLGRLRHRYKRHPEIQCLLLIEESVKLTYQKDLRGAKKRLIEAKAAVSSSTLSEAQDVLKVLVYVASASIFRRQPKKKLGKAFKYLEKAMESAVKLEGVNLTIPKFALAILCHERGRCYMEFATMKSEECIQTEAQTCLGLSIDRFRDLSSENLYSARQCFALIYLARLALPSSMPTSHGQIIPQEDSARAQKLIREFDRSVQLLDEIPIAAEIKNEITKSKLCFLKRAYSGAKKHSLRALRIAKKYGFELETGPARENLNHIHGYLPHYATKTTLAKLQDKTTSSSSYPCSSSTDSDQRAS